MKINTRGSKLEVTDAIRDYINKKIAKLDKYFENPDEFTANVLIKTVGNSQTVEVTIPIRRVILRAEESSEDLYKSIDLVSEKLERQIRKNKTRILNKKGQEPLFMFMPSDDEKEEEEVGVIKKRKQVDMKPMSEEEAILQLNLIGHDFFLFEDMDTNMPAVVYKRKDGNYGIIEMK